MRSIIPPSAVGLLSEIQGDTRYQKTLGVVNIKNAGAVGGDAGDDTAAIQAVLDSSMSIYVPDDTFRITSELVAKLSGQRIYGPGTIRQMTATAGGINFNTGVTNVKVEDITLTGSCTSSQINVVALKLPADSRTQNTKFSGWNIPVWLLGARSRVRGCTINDAIGDGEATSGQQGYGVLVVGPDCRVTDNTIIGIQRHAVYLSGGVTYGGAQRAIVVNNHLENNGAARPVIYIQAWSSNGEATLKGIKVTNNTIRNLNISTAGRGIGIGIYSNVEDAVVADNTIDGQIDTSGVRIFATAANGAPSRIKVKNNVVGGQTAGNVVELVNDTTTRPLNCQITGNTSDLSTAVVSDNGTGTILRDNTGDEGPAYAKATLAANTTMSSAISGSTPLLVSFNSSVETNIGALDTTNSRFTPNRPGRYIVKAFIDLVAASVVTGQYYICAVYKNGTLVDRLFRLHPSATGVAWGAVGTTYVSVNGTTDYIDIRFATGASTAPQVATTSYFELVRIS